MVGIMISKLDSLNCLYALRKYEKELEVLLQPPIKDVQKKTFTQELTLIRKTIESLNTKIKNYEMNLS